MVGTMGAHYVQIMSTLPDCEAIYSIQHEKISTIEDGNKEFGSFSSSIQFQGVNFAYQGRTKTLKNISVSFKKGKTAAIVGRSGSGNTDSRPFRPENGIRLVRVL